MHETDLALPTASTLLSHLNTGTACGLLRSRIISLNVHALSVGSCWTKIPSGEAQLTGPG